MPGISSLHRAPFVGLVLLHSTPHAVCFCLQSTTVQE
jgi:hypothetical protein